MLIKSGVSFFALHKIGPCYTERNNEWKKWPYHSTVLWSIKLTRSKVGLSRIWWQYAVMCKLFGLNPPPPPTLRSLIVLLLAFPTRKPFESKTYVDLRSSVCHCWTLWTQDGNWQGLGWEAVVEVVASSIIYQNHHHISRLIAAVGRSFFMGQNHVYVPLRSVIVREPSWSVSPLQVASPDWASLITMLLSLPPKLLLPGMIPVEPFLFVRSYVKHRNRSS